MSNNEMELLELQAGIGSAYAVLRVEDLYTMQARIDELVFSLDDRDCYITDADMKNAELTARIAELEALIKEADEYLNTNSMTSIGSGSVLHTKFKQALKDNS